MHELIEYICDEMDEMEKKISKGGKLSSAELEYLDMLAHTKKNLLTGDAMMNSEYSNNSYDQRNYDSSYGRGRNARRDSMGRYSSEMGYSRDEWMDSVHKLMQSAPNERAREELQRFESKMRNM